MTELYFRARVEGGQSVDYTELQAALLWMNHSDHPSKARSITMMEEGADGIQPLGVAHFRAGKREPILLTGELNDLMREAAANEL